MSKITPATDIFENEEWKLSRLTLLRIKIEVKIICLYLKLKRFICKR